MNQSDRPTPVIDVHELALCMSDRAQSGTWLLIDVRTEPEFDAAHIAEVEILIPHDELELRLDELADYRDRTVYCVCRSGRRSAYTTELLMAAGFLRVFNVKGGVIAWVNAGFTLVPTLPKE